VSSGRFRIVQTLWFSDAGLGNIKLFDTPVGKLSIRQVVIVLLFAGAGWLSSLLFEDIIYKLAVGGTVFCVGFILAIQKVKVITPERALLLALGFGRMRPSKKKGKTEYIEKMGKEGKKKEKVPVRQVKIQADLESPVKVVGILRDPATGKVLPEKPYEVIVRGEVVSSGISDEQGFFTAFFTPNMFGAYFVEIRPEGHSRGEMFKLIIEPKGGARIA